MPYDHTRATKSLSVSQCYLLFPWGVNVLTCKWMTETEFQGYPWVGLILFYFFGNHSQMSVLNWGILIIQKLSRHCGITGEDPYWASGPGPRFRAALPKSCHSLDWAQDAPEVPFKKWFRASLKTATSPSWMILVHMRALKVLRSLRSLIL